MNPFDQFYALHVYEKAITRADKALYLIAVITPLVVYLTR